MKKFILSTLIALMALTANPLQAKVITKNIFGTEAAFTQGRKKTVHVKSYKRKNGTVVKSHYRSRPRR